MNKLESYSTKQLESEISKRKDRYLGYCITCNKWPVVMTASRSWREELHCSGCRKPIENCQCSRI